MAKNGLDEWHLPVQLEMLKHFGYWTTESSGHCAEYLPYFMPRETDRKAMGLKPFETTADFDGTAPRIGPEKKGGGTPKGEARAGQARAWRRNSGFTLATHGRWPVYLQGHLGAPMYATGTVWGRTKARTT
jgi:hypothetical protein